MKVILGVTGSIAAYKACELVRLFVKNGDEVRVVMTDAAKEFVTPLTFRTLSRNPVYSAQFEEISSWEPEHISLSEADAIAVAPATADIIAKMAHGIADDLLSSVLLATRAPVTVAPAMNDGMWDNPATQSNLAALKNRSITIVEPDAGELACGSEGKGRLADVSAIFRAVLESVKR